MVTFKHETKLKTPELDKMTEVHEKSNVIGGFLDWLQNSRDPRLFICELDQDAEQFYPPNLSIEKLLAEYYNIDLNKVEKERRDLLDYIRQQNNKEDETKSPA
jgi:hypothetical protein